MPSGSFRVRPTTPSRERCRLASWVVMSSSLEREVTFMASLSSRMSILSLSSFEISNNVSQRLSIRGTYDGFESTNFDSVISSHFRELF